MSKTHLEQRLADFAYAGDIEQVKNLLASEVDPSAFNNKALWGASARGHIDIVKLLVADARVNPSSGKNAAIIWAAEYGHLEIVKLLIADVRVNPADSHNAALNGAARNGHYEIVKVLVSDKRVDPTDSNNLAIRRASEKGYIEILQLLLAHAATIGDLKFSEVYRAASVGFLGAVHKSTKDYLANKNAVQAIAKKHANLVENHGWEACSQAISAKKLVTSIQAISFVCRDFSSFVGKTYPANNQNLTGEVYQAANGYVN